MTGHVFISYSHASDGEYVELLADYLIQQGVSVWFDREIISGDRWASMIRTQIDSAVAVVVVMSPASEDSVWVNREIIQAEERGKPIYPLLLKGHRFFRLADVQYEDVTGGQLPPARFVDRLRGYQKRSTAPDAATLSRQFEDAKTLSHRGDYAGAAQLLRYVLKDRKLVLGPDHPDTLLARYWLAYNIGEAGDVAQSIKLMRELVLDSTRVRGADHLATLAALQKLAYSIGKSGDRTQAIKLLREVLTGRTRKLGADHPDTMWTRHQLAYNIGKSGDRAQAAKLFRELAADRGLVLGVDHPDTKLSLKLAMDFS